MIKIKNTKNISIKTWLYISAVLNVLLITGVISIWVIISGAGTNRYSDKILSSALSFVDAHYCGGSGYANMLNEIDNSKGMSVDEKSYSKNYYAFYTCRKGIDNPTLKQPIDQLLKTSKLY